MHLVRLTLHFDAFNLVQGGAYELVDDSGRRTACTVLPGAAWELLPAEAAVRLVAAAVDDLEHRQLRLFA